MKIGVVVQQASREIADFPKHATGEGHGQASVQHVANGPADFRGDRPAFVAGTSLAAQRPVGDIQSGRRIPAQVGPAA